MTLGQPCNHECDPYPAKPIVVPDEEFYAEPLRMDWAPPRIVPCKHCGAPLDRGRYQQMIPYPGAHVRTGLWVRVSFAEWPPWREDPDV